MLYMGEREGKKGKYERPTERCNDKIRENMHEINISVMEYVEICKKNIMEEKLFQSHPLALRKRYIRYKHADKLI